jgi:hypothetical protein
MRRSLPGAGRVGQQVLRQNPVEIEDRVMVESDLLGFVDEEFDRRDRQQQTAMKKPGSS